METLRVAQGSNRAGEGARCVVDWVNVSQSHQSALCRGGVRVRALRWSRRRSGRLSRKKLWSIRESTAMLQKVQNLVGAGASSASRLEPAEKVFAEFEQGLLAIASDVRQFSVHLDETATHVEVPSRLPNVLMFPLAQFVSELVQGTDAVTRSEFKILSVDRAEDQQLVIRMTTSGLPIDDSLMETVNDFFGSVDVTAQERGIAIAGVKS